MDDTREAQNPGEGASSPKRPRLRAARGRKRLRDAPEPPTAQEQDQVMTEVSPNPQPGGSISADRMAEILVKYKTWARKGSPHDQHCFECHKNGNLVPCVTCPRQYHEACKPELSTLVVRDAVALWYCPVCVGFGWHINPPVLTPPASPISETIEAAPAGAHSRLLVGAEPTRTPPREPAATSQAPASQGSTSSARKRQPPAADASTAATQDSTNRVSRSRYATLLPEVDTALKTLTGEVEKVPILQTQVANLKAELASERQSLKIRINELALTKRAAAQAQATNAELQKLREDAAGKQAAVDERNRLAAKNAALELEVETLRGQLQTATKTVQDWKQKLSSMIQTE